MGLPQSACQQNIICMVGNYMYIYLSITTYQ